MPGEILVLLPGMMCDARLFQPQIDEFDQQLKIIVPPLEQPSIESMARYVLDIVDAEKFNLAGLSMGGIVAMAVAGLAPDRILRLGLLDTNHLADPAERRPIRNRQIEAVRAGKLKDVIIDEMKPNYLASENRNNQALLDLLIEMAMALGEKTFVNQSIALRDRGDQTESLVRWHGPALVLCGEEDQLCPPSRHDEMASVLTNAQRETVSGAGHISTLERPREVNEALREWLARPGTDKV